MITFYGQKQPKLKVIGAQGKTRSQTEFDLVTAHGRRWGRMGEGEKNKLAESGPESLFNSSMCPGLLKPTFNSYQLHYACMKMMYRYVTATLAASVWSLL